MDLDRFKIVNDSLGHDVGDQLLVTMARRLKASVRTVDTVARMGGDEFAILLEAATNEIEVLAVVQRIQNRLTAPFEAQGTSLVMSASIGIVMNLANYTRMDDIVRDADIAMYTAKSAGKNQFKVFDVRMRELADEALKVESGLRAALQSGDFRIHYQPIQSLKTQRTIGFEALLRWEHAERGLLYPADFLEAAEESGLIVPIGHWLFFEACGQLYKWQQQYKMQPPLTMSLNLSSRQFAQPDLVQHFADVLKQTGLAGSSLTLELTEMTLIDDMDKAIVKIQQLQALGIQVGIDDFGTGYSSLGYLKHLPVDSLKIDRSFISTLGVSKSAVPIIRAIVAMANSLDMRVIAEGIETQAQATDLLAMACDYGQGFLFDKPLDRDAAHRLIADAFSKQASQDIPKGE